jgi:hypothetical protein
MPVPSNVKLAFLVLLTGCTGTIGGAFGPPGPGGGGGGGGSEPGAFAAGVTVHLRKSFAGDGSVAFGLPIPPGRLAEVSALRVRLDGRAVPFQAKELLAEHDATGARSGVRAAQIVLPAGSLAGDEADLAVAFGGEGEPPAPATEPFAAFAVDSPDVVITAERTIRQNEGRYELDETSRAERTLFVGREPRVLAVLPPGYLAATGILGPQVIAAEAHAPDLAGVAYLSDALLGFGLSAMYAEPYALNPDPDSVPDPVSHYEAWLYDRCATFLIGHAHTGDERFLRHALRSCTYYAGQIALSGPARGTFNGKPDPDSKYSHLRGLYVYYALTGDESALDAGRAMAELWLGDRGFVAPYRQGHLGGADKLWTERLLGTSLEGLYYGYRLTGETRYLDAFREMLTTAHRHISGDAQALKAINPSAAFPPQNCFIHSALQQSEGAAAEPWCSIWMSELSLDVLEQYEAQFGDPRVGEIFIRLARFLRDVGSAYFDANLLADSFLQPSVCFDTRREEDTRRLVPLYGSGLDAAGARRTFGEADDYEHCTDATGLTAAAILALKRAGRFDQNGGGPFAGEGDGFVQLHHEFSFCAARTFTAETRRRRDPRTWTSAELAAGAADPATFIRQNKIGYPQHQIAPLRKLGWWFNMSMLQFALLRQAGIAIPELQPGRVQPAGCN